MFLSSNRGEKNFCRKQKLEFHVATFSSPDTGSLRQFLFCGGHPLLFLLRFSSIMLQVQEGYCFLFRGERERKLIFFPCPC